MQVQMLGELDASPGFRTQRAYGLHEALVFSLEGVGVTLTAGATLLGLTTGVGAGLCATVLAGALLLLHLGHPGRAWRTLAGWRSSWISRGALALATFICLAALALVWRPTGAGAVALGCLQLALAGVIVIYPGLVLGQSPAIPFWRSPFFLLSNVVGGLSSGMAWLLFFVVVDRWSAPGWIWWLQALLLIALAASVVVHLVAARGASGAAGESAGRLLRGWTLLSFVVLGGILGVGVPLALTVVAGAAGPAMLLAAALARTVGDIALRHGLVRVGTYDPVR
jgi:formate-dependent nitrite reductase membrane component NrfD